MKDFVKIDDARAKKEIKTLYNNILALQSEEKYPKRFEFPLALQFELTTHCNVRCKHCYNNSGLNNSYKDRMTPNEWKKFARYLVDKGGIFECIISGGEPLLLGNDLFDIMDILHDDGTFFLLITNGYLLDDEKIKKLSKYRYKWLQISIDGYTSEYHDSFRNRNGSWERAIQGALKVSQAGIPLTIAHSVTPQNLDDVDKMCELAYTLGASSIILGEINLSGRTYENKDLILNNEQKNILYKKFEENFLKFEGKMLVQRSGSVKNQLLKYQLFPTSGAIIRPNGDIRLDCMVPYVLGNVLDNDFYEVWKDKSLNCWKNEEVCNYINNYNEFCESDDNIKNYVDLDIMI